MFHAHNLTAGLVLVMLILPRAAGADEVLFRNGDRISGKVEHLPDGKVKIGTSVVGDVIAEMKDIDAITRAAPATTTATTVATTTPTQPAPAELAKPHHGLAAVLAGQWTGSLKINGNVARGNTNSEDLGVAFDLASRRDLKSKDDRITASGAYNLGGQKNDDGVRATSADNWFAQAKYDHFFTPRWYGYSLLRYDHDRLAHLEYRLSPGVGTGYLWVERPDFNFLTEAGVSYVFEEYSNDGNEDRVAVRLAYKLDKRLNASVSIFHNLEWLPAIEDPGDYNLNTDAGIRAQLTKQWFSEFKVQWQRDSTPAPDALKNDVRLMLGVGWAF